MHDVAQVGVAVRIKAGRSQQPGGRRGPAETIALEVPIPRQYFVGMNELPQQAVAGARLIAFQAGCLA